MKLHRFFVQSIDLTDELSIENKELIHQWRSVLRFNLGREITIFNDKNEEAMYKIAQVSKQSFMLEKIKNVSVKLPNRKVFLCFCILKKDKNEWVLQKGTELGVHCFVPLISDRTEKKGWNSERASKIVVEAAEQCGRVDIPKLYEPIGVMELFSEFEDSVQILVAEQGGRSTSLQEKVAVLIGPEGGWTENEKDLFASANIKQLGLSQFTLRAETAAITAAGLVQLG